MSPNSWTIRTIEKCLDQNAILGSLKIQTKDYRPEGTYPIVDQGQELIAGWTDDPEPVISSPLPLIVFGDHTRAFKFIDFPFVRGADGTQLLKPLPEIDPLFFFYACRAIDLPSRGYNRHFTILKEMTIAIPSARDEQTLIARVLRRAEKVVACQVQQVASALQLSRATKHQLFARGLRNETQKETEVGFIPDSWEVVKLGSLGHVGNGSTPKKSVAGYWMGGTYPWLTSAKVYDRNILQADHFVTARALAECHLPIVKPGSVLIAITGQGKTLGHCAVLGIESTINQHIAYVNIDTKRADPSFVRAYLETQYEHLRQVGSGGGSTKGALTCAFLRSLPIPLPLLDQQREIVAILDAIDQKIDCNKQKRAILEDLFKALLHKLVIGEVGIADLNLGALKYETKREVA